MNASVAGERRERFGRWGVLTAIAGLGVVGIIASGGPRPVTALAVQPGAAPAALRTAADDAKVRRGAYLVKIAGCNDCHTPWAPGPNGPEPDMTRMLSGHPQDVVMPAAPALGEGLWAWSGGATNTAFAGPWGVSFAANLTPDTDSGIGIWTEEIFRDTIRNGRHWGVSRPLLPPMPWPMYRNMTDEDLGAVFAYLQSIEPISNRVPLPVPPAEAAQ